METVEAVKTRLRQFGELNRERDFLLERYEALAARAYSTGAANLDGMPRNESKDPDRTGIIVGQLEEIREASQEMLSKILALHRDTNDYITQLKRRRVAQWPEKVAVLQMRYLDLLSWSDVAFSVFGNRGDYVGKEDTFLRRVHRLHSNALQELAEFELEANPERQEMK